MHQQLQTNEHVQVQQQYQPNPSWGTPDSSWGILDPPPMQQPHSAETHASSKMNVPHQQLQPFVIEEWKAPPADASPAEKTTTNTSQVHQNSECNQPKQDLNDQWQIAAREWREGSSGKVTSCDNL